MVGIPCAAMAMIAAEGSDPWLEGVVGFAAEAETVDTLHWKSFVTIIQFLSRALHLFMMSHRITPSEPSGSESTGQGTRA